LRWSRGGIGTLSLIAIVVITFVILNVVSVTWDHAQYGRVNTRSSTVLRLPEGTIEVGFADHRFTFNGRVPDMSVPNDLTLSVVPAAGVGPRPGVHRDEESSPNSYSDNQANVEIRIWKLQIPRAGDYRVTSAGGYGPPSELVFGAGRPLSVGWVWLVAGTAMLAVIVAWSLLALRDRRRSR
jgi:hypothetical protein